MVNILIPHTDDENNYLSNFFHLSFSAAVLLFFPSFNLIQSNQLSLVLVLFLCAVVLIYGANNKSFIILLIKEHDYIQLDNDIGTSHMCVCIGSMNETLEMMRRISYCVIITQKLYHKRSLTLGRSDESLIDMNMSHTSANNLMTISLISCGQFAYMHDSWTTIHICSLIRMFRRAIARHNNLKL